MDYRPTPKYARAGPSVQAGPTQGIVVSGGEWSWTLASVCPAELPAGDRKLRDREGARQATPAGALPRQRAGSWYSPSRLPPGSVKRAVISGASLPIGWTILPPAPTIASSVAATLSTMM